YGIGDHSPAIDESNYTEQQKYVQGMLGWNLDHDWQVAYTVRARAVEVRPGTLVDIVSIQRRFATLLGIGLEHEVLNRVAITYDSRDDPTVPQHGSAIVAYGGVAASEGIFNASLYSLVGLDVRQLWTPSTGDT